MSEKNNFLKVNMILSFSVAWEVLPLPPLWTTVDLELVSDTTRMIYIVIWCNIDWFILLSVAWEALPLPLLWTTVDLELVNDTTRMIYTNLAPVIGNLSHPQPPLIQGKYDLYTKLKILQIAQ